MTLRPAPEAKPVATLAGAIVRTNARAHAAGGLPVAAVVKADGYGWGAARLAALLEDVVESYFVSGLGEFRSLRPHTALPIRLLGDVPDDALPEILRCGGIPNVSTLAALEAVSSACAGLHAPSIRLGTIRVAGWSTPAPEAWPALARALAGSGIGVELWTHVTSPERARLIEDELLARKATLEACGVRIASIDAAATSGVSFAAARSRIRVGAGLFGVRAGSTAATRCAITFRAPVVRRYRAGEMPSAGYGIEGPPGALTVVRAGYADGIPQSAAGHGAIVAVGMQFTTVRGASSDDAYTFVDGTTDLDELARAWSLNPRELVLSVARAAR